MSCGARFCSMQRSAAVAGAMASEVAIMFKTRNISVVPVVDDQSPGAAPDGGVSVSSPAA